MLAFTALALWLILVIAPDTAIGRTLQRWLVAAPARRLSRVGRGHVVLAVLLVAAVGAVIWIMEQDGILLMSMAAPEVAAFLTTFEISAYLDVIAALAMAASAMRLRAVGLRLRHIVTRQARMAPRSARARKAPRPVRRDAANDDGEDRAANSSAESHGLRLRHRGPRN